MSRESRNSKMAKYLREYWLAIVILLLVGMLQPWLAAGAQLGVKRDETSPPLSNFTDVTKRVQNEVKSEAPDFFVADNSARRVEFTPGGLRYLPKAESGLRAEFAFHYRLQSITSGRESYFVGAHQQTILPVSASDEVFYSHPMDILEKYRALDAGLEQFFIFAREFNPTGVDLVITGEVATDLRAESPTRDGGITFYSRGEPILRYGPVKVTDAARRETRGELRQKGNHLSITIDSRWLKEAAYPVMVNPAISLLLPVTTIAPSEPGSSSDSGHENSAVMASVSSTAIAQAASPFSIPGLILGLRHNENQQLEPSGYMAFFSAPDGAPVDRMDGGDIKAALHRGYEWWRVRDNPSADPASWKLPPGIVFGLKHSQNQRNLSITVFGRDSYFGPSSFPGFTRQAGGDLGAPSGQGYYWYESTGEGFSDWSSADNLPRWTVLGLKHSINQRDKKCSWKGVTYDPANREIAPPPGFVRMVGGDLGAPAGEGYYWYEKITGPEVVVKPQLRVTLSRSLLISHSDSSDLDQDRDGLVDNLENYLANTFRPLSIFDSAENARQPFEPVTLFRVRRLPTSTLRIQIKWVFLFGRDGGYGPANIICLKDDHDGDSDDGFYEFTSNDSGLTWTLDRAGLSFKGLEWPTSSRLEVYDLTHPIIYMSASKHHEYFTRDWDLRGSLYSKYGCKDNVNGQGAKVLVNLRSLDPTGVRYNNVGEPRYHSDPFVNDLGRYYSGHSAWGFNNFYQVGPLREKWMPQGKIRIRFADAPPKLACGVKDIPNFINPYPKEHRQYVSELFEDVYSEITKLYGEPLTEHPEGLTVTIYYVPNGDASMYLSHKSEIEVKVLAPLVASIFFWKQPGLWPIFLTAGTACALFAEIPDHAIFLHKLPSEQGFDNLFTHELIHTFHDRMDYLGWYTHSWIEEGMTEAATELVADSLHRQPNGRDLRIGGLNAGPWDNLKHYDMWDYPFNGAWLNQNTGFSVLGGLQFFFGGIAIPPQGDEKIANHVIDPTIRYAAATSVWLMLTKALSTNPAEPDFLRRLNEQLDRDKITKQKDGDISLTHTLIKEIEKIVGDAKIEELPVRDWILQQGIVKGAPAGFDYLFIHVKNPENLNLLPDRDGNGNPQPADDITVYAVAKEDLPNPANPLGELSIGELPARNCSVNVKITDAFGKAWVNENGLTGNDGKYVLQSAITLPRGGYTIQATADNCSRVHEGPAQSRVPTGMKASTFAIVSGENITGDIKGANTKLFGATIRPSEIRSGAYPNVKVVKAETTAAIIAPAFQDLKPKDGMGFFNVEVTDPRVVNFSNPLVFRPMEVLIGQRDPAAAGRFNHPRAILKPNPYTRVVWLGASSDFSLAVQPKQSTVERGKAADVAVEITPNGVEAGTFPPRCPGNLFVNLVSVPRGVKLTPDYGLFYLGANAPHPTKMQMRVEVGQAARPGTYDIEINAYGESGTDCSGIVRSTNYQLNIPYPPVQVSLNAVQVIPGGTPMTINVPVVAMTSAGTTTQTTPFTLSPLQGTELTLQAEGQISVGGRVLKFLDWEYDNNPNQRASRNPLTLSATSDLTLKARYLEEKAVSLTVAATTSGATVDIRIPVPISYGWTTSQGILGGGTRTTVFEILPPRGINVTFEAPLTVKVGDRSYEFTIWKLGDRAVTQNKLTYLADGNATLVARYQPKPPTPQVQPGSLSFSAQVGQPNPPAQTLSISNGGNGILNWTASTNASWLSISPATGATPSSASVSVNLAGLPAGTYQGQITIRDTAPPNRSVQLPVTLTIRPSPRAVLTVQATCEGCATGPVQIAVPIAVATSERSFTQTTAFNFENPIGERFSLQAPASVTINGKTLQFKHWFSVTDQKVLKTTPLLSGFSDKTETFAAVYQVQAANGALNIVSICEGCVTGPVQFSGATVTVSSPALGDRLTPFNLEVVLGNRVSLTAAATASAGGKGLQFKHWLSVTDNRVITTNRTLSGSADKTETLAAVYQVAQAPLVTLRVETRLSNGNALTNVPLSIISPCQVQGGCLQRTSPDGSFQLTLNAGATAQLRAPKYSNGSEQCNVTFCLPRFVRWRVGAQTLTTEQTVTIAVNQNTTVVAEYQ